MRVLVCGSRDFENRRLIYAVLNGLSWEATSDEDGDDIIVIEGGATGADTYAAQWATQCSDDEGGPTLWSYPADWEKYGKRAGPIRNQQMLDEGQPDLVVAFINKPLAESRGTAHMVSIAREAGIPTWVVEA